MDVEWEGGTGKSTYDVGGHVPVQMHARRGADEACGNTESAAERRCSSSAVKVNPQDAAASSVPAQTPAANQSPRSEMSTS